MSGKNVTLYIAVIISISFLIGILTLNIGKSFYEDGIKSEMESSGKLLGDIISNDLTGNGFEYNDSCDYYSNMLRTNITITDNAGIILASSALSNGEILNLSEYTFADNEISDFSIRIDRNTNAFRAFYTVRINNETVLRMEKNADKIYALHIETIIIILFSDALLITLLIIFSKNSSRRKKTIATGLKKAFKAILDNYNYHLELPNDNEFIGVDKAYNTMAKELKYIIEAYNDKNNILISLLNGLDNGVIAVGTDYKILFINTSVLSIFNVTDKAYYGYFFEIIRHSTLFELINFVVAEKESIVREFSLKNYNEDNIFRASAEPLFSKENGKLYGVIINIFEITKIRKLEKLHYDFALNVSHALEPPVTSITNSVETLINAATNDESISIQFLNTLDSETKRLNRLMDEIFINSEAEAETQDIIVKYF